MRFFDKLASPLKNVWKYASHHFWVYSRAKDILRNAKIAVISLFWILVGKPMGGIIPPSPPRSL